MKVGRARLYALLAIAVAVTYGVGVGRYWLTDAAVLVVLGGAVASFCLAGINMESLYAFLGFGLSRMYRRQGATRRVVEPDKREHIPRSRIEHYVSVSRIRSATLTAWLRRESDSPFERALFSEPGWQRLSGESLEEITRKAPAAPAKSTQ